MVIREVQIKITTKYPFTFAKNDKKYKSDKHYVLGCGGHRTPVHCGGGGKVIQPFWKTT